MAGGGQHGENDLFLHGVGVGAGGVEHHNTRFAATVDGNIVRAGTGAGNGAQGLGELIIVHLGGADEDAVGVGAVVLHHKAALIQLSQTHAGDLIQSLDANR